MNNPMNWALNLFRAFGLQVRVHILFFIVTLGLFLRQISLPGNVVWWGDVFLFTIVLLFVIILLHEFGHCFGGRGVGGEAEEILIWPLGGLAFVSVPKDWKSHTFTAFAGPLVNIVICFITAVIISASGFVPTLNPFADPYKCEMSNFRDNKTYTSEYGVRVYMPNTNTEAPAEEFRSKLGNEAALNEAIVKSGLDRALAPSSIVWLNRTFWLSWVLLLFNLLPVYPLDGGQMLQGLLWWRVGYYRGTRIAVIFGFVCAVGVLIASIAANEALLLGLGMFLLFSCMMKLRELESEESPFGSEFNLGRYDDDDLPVKPKRIGFLRRWRNARAARKLQRQAEAVRQDEDRMDHILEKIAQQGKASLTDDERKFMERVSARYRKK